MISERRTRSRDSHSSSKLGSWETGATTTMLLRSDSRKAARTRASGSRLPAGNRLELQRTKAPRQAGLSLFVGRAGSLARDGRGRRRRRRRVFGRRRELYARRRDDFHGDVSGRGRRRRRRLRRIGRRGLRGPAKGQRGRRTNLRDRKPVLGKPVARERCFERLAEVRVGILVHENLDELPRRLLVRLGVNLAQYLNSQEIAARELRIVRIL